MAFTPLFMYYSISPTRPPNKITLPSIPHHLALDLIDRDLRANRVVIDVGVVADADPRRVHRRAQLLTLVQVLLGEFARGEGDFDAGVALLGRVMSFSPCGRLLRSQAIYARRGQISRENLIFLRRIPLRPPRSSCLRGS